LDLCSAQIQKGCHWTNNDEEMQLFQEDLNFGEEPFVILDG
jgi:hypothetical protein